jgi:hypothetical protein
MKMRIWSLIAVALAVVALLVAQLASAGHWPQYPLALAGMVAVALTGSAMQDAARQRSIAGRLVELYKKTAVIMLNVAVCFVCLELTSTGMVKARTALARTEERDIDPRSASSYYASQSWATVYWQEFSASRRQRYRPFVLWRRGAFAGQTINIDDNGIRATPGSSCGPQSLKVFVIGGSTVWGTGSPDWGTLPAYLEGELQRATRRSVCVVNYGESAYVSTQSVLQLLLQLQSANVPDLVISYDGLNDVYSAYQSGKAGVHENLAQLVASFEGGETTEQGVTARAMRHTNLFGLTEALLQKVTSSHGEPPKVFTYQNMGVDEKSLSDAIVKTYFGNYGIVESLARQYGFDFRFFWPPYIRMGHKPLIPEEEAIANEVDPPLDRLYQSVQRGVSESTSAYLKLIDLTNIFDDHPDLVWIDDMHVTPIGNQILAGTMTRALDLSALSTRSSR